MSPYALAAFLVLAGNAADLLDAGGLPGASAAHLAFGLALSAAVLAWARRARLGRAALGVAGSARAAAIGAALGLAGALAGLLVLRFPLVTGPIAYAPVAGVDAAALALHLAVFLPLGVVVPEELAFRGVLLAALRARGTDRRAVAVTAVAFAAWHATIVVPTIRAAGLAAQPALAALALACAAVVLVAGGALLALLRIRCGSIAAPIAAHWVFDAALLVGLRLAS